MTITRLVVYTMLLAAVSGSGAAQDLDVRPVEIRAALSDQQTSAKGALRLMPAKDLAVTLLAGDLTTAQGETISGNTISLPGEATLKKGQPKDLLVQIDGIRHAGVYSGSVDVYAEDPQHKDAGPQHQAVAITLTVVAMPKLTLVGAPPIVWTVVHCSNRATCGFVDRLLPTAMRGDHRLLVVEDQRGAGLPVDAQLLTTAANGTDLNATVTVPQPGAAAVGNRYQATATFSRGGLLPGVYPAVIELKPRDRGEALSQPVTVDVRVGPFVALFAILAGVVVGRISQSLSTPLFQFQSGLLGRVHRLRNDAQQIADLPLQAVMRERVNNVLDRIELATAADAALTADVDDLTAQIVAALRYDRLVALVSQLPDPARRVALQPQMDAIRQSILQGAAPAATTQMRAAETTIGAAPALVALAQPEAAPDPAVVAAAPVPPTPPLLLRVLRALAGTRATSVEVQYALVKPLLFLVLLVVLCLTGFNTLYVKAAAGFGSAGLFDQLGLFMWGLTADVAQGTLQRLPK